MKKFNLNSRIARKGGVAFTITAIIIVIIIILNMVIGQLPSSYKEFDISDQRIYSVSDTAKEYISTLETDIEMIIVSEETMLDPRVSKYIYNYAAQSEHINVSQVDPVMYPSVLETYGCAADTLVVLSPVTGKMAQIPLYGYSDSIIVYELDYSTYSYVESQFAAEGLITSAIDRVTSNTSSTVYTLTGHGEAALSASATEIIERSNITVNAELDLLMDGGIPEDCSLIICYNPMTDLAPDELTMINDYMAKGGDMVLFMDNPSLTNFNTLMGDYGLAMQAGFLGEYEQYYAQYAQYYGYFCMAPVLSGDITADIETNAIILYPKPMTISAPSRDNIAVEPFMTTTANGLYFANEEADPVVGQYIIGAVASEETENGTANLTVVSAVTMIDPGITDTYPNMANLDIFLNMVTNDMGDVSGVSIPAKSLGVTYNTFSFTDYGVWAIIFIFVLPITCLVCGLAVWLRRRKR